MLAPVHAGYGDEYGHGDRRDEEQPSPPAASVTDDQDRDADVEAARGGLVPGRVRRGGQVLVELGDIRPGPFDHGGGSEEHAEFPEHDGGYEDDRPPAPGDGQEDDTGGEGGDEAAVAALADEILGVIGKEPLYFTDVAERFSAYDFRTVARALGHLHTTERLWQDPRGRMCVRGSEFAAKPPRR